MALVEYLIRLDLKKEHEQGVQHVKYGDTNSRYLRFQIHSGGKTYDISDKKAVLHYKKSDGTEGSIRCFHRAEKGVCECLVSSQMTAVAGEVKCDLKIFSGDTLLHSPKFYLLVGTDALSGDTSADDFGDEKADKVEDAVEGNLAALDSEGNLIDSGKAVDDFADEEHTHTYDEVIDFASGVVYYTPAGGEIVFPIVYWVDDTPLSTPDEGDYWYAPTAMKLYKADSVPGSGMTWTDVTNTKLKNNSLFVRHNGRVYYCVDGELREIKTTLVSHTHVKSDITDFAHTHAKSDVTDFAHTHTVSDITDFPDTPSGIPEPTSNDFAKKLCVTSDGKYLLSTGAVCTVSISFASGVGSSPTAIWIESPSGIRYSDEDAPVSFDLIEGEVVKCYVSYSLDDNYIKLNGTTVAGDGGSSAYYELTVEDDASIYVTGSGGSFGLISITM
ncbi:MAG: BppU family phage baseplate upper protein [Clostridia bacterium]|nr:BppU family phage baseplate upper protein [Clostridia bacterium]MBR5769841.1 BppU family phage baseplate upper protein [Clostridia bacterium]